MSAANVSSSDDIRYTYHFVDFVDTDMKGIVGAKDDNPNHGIVFPDPGAIAHNLMSINDFSLNADLSSAKDWNAAAEKLRKIVGGDVNRSNYSEIIAYGKKYLFYTEDPNHRLHIHILCVDLGSFYADICDYLERKYKTFDYYADPAGLISAYINKTYKKNPNENAQSSNAFILYDMNFIDIKSFPERLSEKIIRPPDGTDIEETKFKPVLSGKITFEMAFAVAAAEAATRVLAIIKNNNEKVKYLSFSDTHGDIAAFLMPFLVARDILYDERFTEICPDKSLRIIPIGDYINQKMDYFTGKWADKYSPEFKFRDELINEFIEKFKDFFGSDKFIPLLGNHDIDMYKKRNFRAVVVAPRYQLLFQHAITSDYFERRYIERMNSDVVANGDHRIVLYQLTDNIEESINNNNDDYPDLYGFFTMRGFSRATKSRNDNFEGPGLVDAATSLRRIIEDAITKSGISSVLNPIFTFGHDFTYIFLPYMVGNKIQENENNERRYDEGIKFPMNDNTYRYDYVRQNIELNTTGDLFNMRLLQLSCISRVFNADGNIVHLYSAQRWKNKNMPNDISDMSEDGDGDEINEITGGRIHRRRRPPHPGPTHRHKRHGFFRKHHRHFHRGPLSRIESIAGLIFFSLIVILVIIIAIISAVKDKGEKYSINRYGFNKENYDRTDETNKETNRNWTHKLGKGIGSIGNGVEKLKFWKK